MKIIHSPGSAPPQVLLVLFSEEGLIGRGGGLFKLFTVYPLIPLCPFCPFCS